MNASKTSWKLFRIVCIIQMILVALQLMISFSNFFNTGFFFITLVKVVLYAGVFVFVYMGLSLINYNFPDIPLTVRQKRFFNWLFIINFLLIAFLFAEVVNRWWVIPLLIELKGHISTYLFFYWLSPFAVSTIVFIQHLVFLG